MTRTAVLFIFFVTWTIPAIAADARSSAEPRGNTPTRVREGDVPSPASSLDDQPIRHSMTVAKEASRSDDPSMAPEVTLQPARVVGALAAVIGLVFLLRWGAKRMLTTSPSGRASSAIRVLSRAVLSPRQQLMVVQVGRRLIVIGDSGNQMNPLCEISEPNEVAALVAQLTVEKSASSATAFSAFFRKPREEPEEPFPAARDQPEDSRESEPDPLAATRHELQGLMEKVRTVSRQLGNS